MPGEASEIGRVVALGASNLTRGFHTVVSTARASWGPDVEVLAALGHGRSYGVRNQFLVRALPGILECGLWRELESRPRRPTRALVTDVGNDIVYGFSAGQILEWIDDAIGRLRRVTADIVVTDLPMAAIRAVSEAKFRFIRSILFPSCRVPLVEVKETAERVDAGLAQLSAAHGARLLHLKPEWYGFDPIHIRPALWRPAWREILGTEPEGSEIITPRLEGLRLYVMPPERRWICGVEQVTAQPGVALRAGGRIWTY
jgi:hypothetical protein